MDQIVKNACIKMLANFAENVDKKFKTSFEPYVFLCFVFKDENWLRFEDKIKKTTGGGRFEIVDSKTDKKYAEFCKKELEFFYKPE